MPLERPRPLQLLFGRQNRWPNPQDSTGVYLATIGRNKSCWEAIGPARSVFNELQDDIAQYINQTCESVQKGVVWSLYMVGRTRESSSPVITFSSGEPGAREKLRESIKESKLLEKHPGFKTMSIDRPVECASGIVETLGGAPDAVTHTAASPAEEISVSTSSNNFMGSSITLNSQSSSPVATSGGCVRFNGKLYMVSVAHPFEEHWNDGFQAVAPPGDYIFDIDDPSDEDEMDEIMVGVTSGGSMTSDSSSCDESDCASSAVSNTWSDFSHVKDELVSTISGNRDRRTFEIINEDPTITGTAGEGTDVGQVLNAAEARQSTRIGRLNFILKSPTISSGRGGTRALDYALFELPPSIVQLLVSNITEDILKDHPKSVAREPRSTEVIVHTTTGPIAGRLLATSSYKQFDGRALPNQLWSVLVEGILEKGVCGAWVVDAVSNELYGHIIAGATEDGFAYIIPFYEILDDLNTHFGKSWALADAKNDLGKSLSYDTSFTPGTSKLSSLDQQIVDIEGCGGTSSGTDSILNETLMKLPLNVFQDKYIRHTPESLGWLPGTDLLKRHRYVTPRGAEPYFKLFSKWENSYQSPRIIYLDKVFSKEGDKQVCRHPNCAKNRTLYRTADLYHHYRVNHCSHIKFKCKHVECSIYRSGRKDKYEEHLKRHQKESRDNTAKATFDVGTWKKIQEAKEAGTIGDRWWQCAKCLGWVKGPTTCLTCRQLHQPEQKAWGENGIGNNSVILDDKHRIHVPGKSTRSRFRTSLFSKCDENISEDVADANTPLEHTAEDRREQRSEDGLRYPSGDLGFAITGSGLGRGTYATFPGSTFERSENSALPHPEEETLYAPSSGDHAIVDKPIAQFPHKQTQRWEICSRSAVTLLVVLEVLYLLVCTVITAYLLMSFITKIIDTNAYVL